MMTVIGLLVNTGCKAFVQRRTASRTKQNGCQPACSFNYNRLWFPSVHIGLSSLQFLFTLWLPSCIYVTFRGCPTCCPDHSDQKPLLTQGIASLLPLWLCCLNAAELSLPPANYFNWYAWMRLLRNHLYSIWFQCTIAKGVGRISQSEKIIRTSSSSASGRRRQWLHGSFMKGLKLYSGKEPLTLLGTYSRFLLVIGWCKP